MKRVFSFLGAMVLMCGTALAQQGGSTVFGGVLVGPANMKIYDALAFSQTENSYMSARVAGMGGAFTSLGADLSTMSINPAGLGMYTSSAFAVSLDMSPTRYSNSFNPRGTSQFSMDVNQIGVALNLYQGTGPLVSFTFGLAYNKLADLNYNNRYQWSDDGVSIAEFFAEQVYGFNPLAMLSSADPFRNGDFYPDEWGGILAYQTYLIDPLSDDSNPVYDVPALPPSSRVHPGVDISSRGTVGEYAISSGVNFANILYLGATIGVHDINQRINYVYSEQYSHSESGNLLNSMRYEQLESNYGDGINLKIGAVLRPLSSLRLGVAYHTRTVTSITRDYWAAMETRLDKTYNSESLVNHFTTDYLSPSKLLLGASYTLSNLAVVSFDYDVVWYDRIGDFFTMDQYLPFLDEAAAADFTRSHNMRIGLEVRPMDNLYLRGGYAYYGSPLKSIITESNNPCWGTYKTTTENFSLGLGWRFESGSSVDLAWTLSQAHYTSALLYDYYSSDVDEGYDPIVVSSPVVSANKAVKNVINATYTVRF